MVFDIKVFFRMSRFLMLGKVQGNENKNSV